MHAASARAHMYKVRLSCSSPVQSKLENVLEKATRLNLKFFAKTVRRVRRKALRVRRKMPV